MYYSKVSFVEYASVPKCYTRNLQELRQKEAGGLAAALPGLMICFQDSCTVKTGIVVSEVPLIMCEHDRLGCMGFGLSGFLV